MFATFDTFLNEAYPPDEADSAAARAVAVDERQDRMAVFPYTVILQMVYPELDFANRWCWQQFGPAQGDCQQYSSEYPACREEGRHAHQGRWMTHWLAKTDYNFGFNEWCFSNKADQDRFVAFVPSITWGEKYPS